MSTRAVYHDVTITHQGINVVVLPNATITVYNAGTTTPITQTMYTTDAGVTVLPNPFTSDADGNFSIYTDLEQQVKLVITHALVDPSGLTVDDIQLRAPAGSYATLTGTQTLINKKIGLQDGSVSAPSLYFESETGDNTGLYKTNEAEMAVTIDGTQVVLIDSAGIKIVGKIRLADGTASAPTILFSSEPGLNSGFYKSADSEISASIDTVQTVVIDATGLKVIGKIRVADGTVSLPSILFSSETGANSGLYKSAEAEISAAIDGVQRLLIDALGIKSIGIVRAADGTVSLPSFVFSSEPGLNSGIYKSGDSEVAVSIDGTQKLLVKATGVKVTGVVEHADGTVSLPSILFTSETGLNSGFYKSAEAEIAVSIDGVQTVIFDATGIKAIAKIRLPDGTVSLPSLYFTSEPGANSGFYKSADSELAATIDGTQRLVIDGTGIKAGGTVRAADGTVSLPSILFTNEPGLNSGFYKSADSQVAVAIDGTLLAIFKSLGIDVAGIVTVADGSASNPSLTFRSETGLNTGIYRISEGKIGVTIDGTLAFTLDVKGIISTGTNGYTQLKISAVNSNPASGYASMWVDANERYHNTSSAGTTTSVGGQPVTTYLVAANDSPANIKANADYICDGTSDETEINAAITAGGTKSKIVLGPGTFNITASITMTASGQTLEGFGAGVTIIFASNSAGTNTNLVNSSQTFTTLRNFTIDGNKAQNSGRTSTRLFNITGAYAVMESVHGKNSAGNGANFASSGGVCQNVSVLGSDFVGYLCTGTSTPGSRFVACAAVDNVGDGFYITGSYNTFNGCMATGNGAAGYYLVSATSNSLTGCSAKSNTGPGFVITGSFNTVIGCNALSNTSYNMQIASAFNNVVGCNVISGGSIGIYITGANCSIKDNYVYQSSIDGIYVDAADCSIVGNHVYQNGISINNSYINIYMTANADNCNVQGNTCRKGAASPQAAYGIYLAAGATANLVTNNDLLTSGATGSLLDSGTSTVTTAGNRL